MALVVYKNVQYDDQNLPVGVPADLCVPVDEWFSSNSVGRHKSIPAPAETRPPQRRRKPKKDPSA